MWESKEEAAKLASDLSALGVSASVWDRRACRGDEVVTHYTVEARIIDARSGNGVSRSFREPTAAAKAAKEMKTELRDLSKSSRSHKRSERAAGQS